MLDTLSLGISLLPVAGSVRINIIGHMPWCEHLSVGETIDIPMPEVGRVGMSWTRCPTGDSYMNPIALLLLALAMSTDAFAAAIGKGAGLKKLHFPKALRTGLIFGSIEAVTPLIGWFIGKAATAYVETWDHWVAFILLVALGLHMIYQGLKPDDGLTDKPSTHSFLLLAVTAIGTSIDALAVGISLAFVDVNIWLAAGLIGLATTVMATLGIMLGRVVGSVLGHRAEIAGGVTLMTIGTWILSTHI